MINTYDGSALPTDPNHIINKTSPSLMAVLEDVLQANAAVWPKSFNIPQPCNLISGEIDISGYGGTDVISAQCNFDGGANYNTSYATKTKKLWPSGHKFTTRRTFHYV